MSDPNDIRIASLADHLVGLLEIQNTCLKAGLYPEASIADGLVQLLAVHVRDHSVPGTPQHRIAEHILKPGESS